MAAGQILRGADWRHRFDRCNHLDLHHGPGRAHRHDELYAGLLSLRLVARPRLPRAACGRRVDLSRKGLRAECASRRSFAVGDRQHPQRLGPHAHYGPPAPPRGLADRRALVAADTERHELKKKEIASLHALVEPADLTLVGAAKEQAGRFVIPT
jgi:hypothetical protein